MATILHGLDMATTTDKTLIVRSQHQTKAAATRALYRLARDGRTDAVIIHEPETHVTNQRWLVATPEVL